MQIHLSPVAPNSDQLLQHPIMKLPRSIFIRHKTDEIPQNYTAKSRIIFSLFNPNCVLNNNWKYIYMTLEWKVIGVV